MTKIEQDLENTGRFVETEEPIHDYFGLTYASYLTLNRTVLQSMPLEWQRRFVACLSEADEAARELPSTEYRVDTGRWRDVSALSDDALRSLGWEVAYPEGDRTFTDPEGNEVDAWHGQVFVPGPDPIPHYQRGRTRVELIATESR